MRTPQFSAIGPAIHPGGRRGGGSYGRLDDQRTLGGGMSGQVGMTVIEHDKRTALAAAAARRSRERDESGGRPRLSPERELRLVLAAQAGDVRARERLVEEFRPLIASVARRYRGVPAVDRAELFQEGVVGLLRALERYDAEQGTPFWAYARWWVRVSMQELVSELSGPIVLSDRALRQLARIKDARREALAESGQDPSYKELALRTGLPVHQVGSLLAAERAARSTEESVSHDDGAAGTIGELLADARAETEYQRALDAIETRKLPALLAALPERDRAILRGRYGLDGEERRLSELGEKFAISAERVRQIECGALDKLAVAAGADWTA
jgi:RNA polymerase sigma factor (sigma-70 family)